MVRIAALALGVFLFPVLAGAAPPNDCPAPPATDDGWPVSSPQGQGLDPGLICAIGPSVSNMKPADAHAVVVVRHGVLVYEHYFSAADEHAPGEIDGTVPRDAKTLHEEHSITKSVTAILTGIALDRGWLKSLDASVFSFLPQYADLDTPEKSRITLRDLLTMTSGFDWPELAISSGDPSNIMWGAADPFRFVLARKLAASPGSLWNYNNGAVDLLGLVLQKVSGLPLDQFAKEALFAPLGITRFQWATAADGLWLRPRDLVKIGQLVLNRGMWQGKRIVSAAWIEAMTTPEAPPHSLAGTFGDTDYGYLWWLGHSATPRRDVGWTAGVGYGGQRLFVVPGDDLVVAVNAGIYTRRVLDMGFAGDTVLDGFVLPALLGR